MFRKCRTENVKNLATSNTTMDENPVEEWIWVKGYKGTDKDMRCRDRQFELNKRFDISEDKPVELREHGFHFCRDLYDVYKHYSIGNGNRFFRVKALVRKSDYEKLGGNVGEDDNIAAKSIIFTRELTMNTITKAWFIFNMINL